MIGFNWRLLWATSPHSSPRRRTLRLSAAKPSGAVSTAGPYPPATTQNISYSLSGNISGKIGNDSGNTGKPPRRATQSRQFRSRSPSPALSSYTPPRIGNISGNNSGKNGKAGSTARPPSTPTSSHLSPMPPASAISPATIPATFRQYSGNVTRQQQTHAPPSPHPPLSSRNTRGHICCLTAPSLRGKGVGG